MTYNREDNYSRDRKPSLVKRASVVPLVALTISPAVIPDTLPWSRADIDYVICPRMRGWVGLVQNALHNTPSYLYQYKMIKTHYCTDHC